MTEKDLLSFQEDIQELNPIECDAKAIDLINFIEDNNLNIEDYKYLNFYASFNNLLENGRLKDYLRHNSILNEETDTNIILNEDTKSPLQKKRSEVTKLILDSLKLVDRSGLNVEKYKNFYESMNDKEFEKFMNDFFKDDDKNFYLEILPNKSEPTIAEIESLLKKLNIPKEEYVYYRDDGFKDDPLRTREKCTVGYVVVRRLQQILSKKNTYSLDIDNRDSKTGQVTGADKIARISDELMSLHIAIYVEKPF